MATTGPALGAGLPLLPAMPSSKAPLRPSSVVLYALKLRLPHGEGLARMLIQAGVDQSDAAIVAKLAAGHLGVDAGGCDAKVEMSNALSGAGYRLSRVVLLTSKSETTIERRDGQLTIAGQSAASTVVRLT